MSEEHKDVTMGVCLVTTLVFDMVSTLCTKERTHAFMAAVAAYSKQMEGCSRSAPLDEQLRATAKCVCSLGDVFALVSRTFKAEGKEQLARLEAGRN